MADKAVSELIEAKQVSPGDLFVLEQDGTAKKLTGQTLENWLLQMAQGHGGIHSIEKVGSNGLTDTYRMTFADTSTFDYIITNGRGIKSIAKTKTSGLTDTYTVTFNDGTTFDYTVTNGAKGDKGDAWYVWFKYASQMPTEASHSMGDVIDNCMGIYSGTQPTKPTDWKAYQWFQIKGEKGNTGDPAILLGWKTEYQASTSGKVPPSGAWSEELPVIKQGTYLWTRTTQTYNSGSPVVAYSVGYLGKDGTVTFEELTPAQKDEIRGGYYSPIISQPDKNTMQLVFAPSKDDMPSVEQVNVTLPAGGAGGTSGCKAGNGGSDGGNGRNNENGGEKGGTGQGTTTREFGESTGNLYAGGGGGGYDGGAGIGGAGGGGNGGDENATPGQENSGGGGGGNDSEPGANGGSGIVIIRNAR